MNALISRSLPPLTAGRWGAGFAAVARFVAEIEAAAASNGPLRPAMCSPAMRHSFSTAAAPR